MKGRKAVINSEILKQIAKEFGKSSDKTGLHENNVFLSPKDGYQTFYMTSDSFSLEKRIQTQEQITASIPVNEFRHKISVLPNKEDITLYVENNKLVLGWGSKGSKIKAGLSEDLSPLIEIPDVVEWITWSPGVIHKIYREFVLFTAKNYDPIAQSLPVLTGVYITKNDFEETYIRATDSTKAASMVTKKLDWFSVSASIPSSTLAALSEIIPTDVNVEIGIDKDNTLLVFKTTDTTVVSRILTGQFPKIDHAYTLSEKDAITIYRLDLQGVLDVCIRASRLGTSSRILKIEPVKNKIFGFTNILGEFISGSVVGDPNPIVIDADNLYAAARLFRGDEISLLISKKNGPVTVLNEGSDLVQALIGQIKS